MSLPLPRGWECVGGSDYYGYSPTGEISGQRGQQIVPAFGIAVFDIYVTAFGITAFA